MKYLISVAVLSLALVVAGAGWGGQERTGTLAGQFMITGDTPMSDGMVYLYSLASGPAPSHDRYWRVPDFVEKLDASGRFAAELPPGEYCVGAIKRQKSNQIGPPLEGDHFALGLDDNRSPRRYTVAPGEKRDIGVVSGAQPFKSPVARTGITAIEGTVHDTNGAPLEGAMVFAFITSTIVGKPLFVSDRSGKDGRFLLRVHEGGTFYLKVRDNYGGGPPRGGDVLDGKKETPLQKVSLKTGEIVRGISVTGKKFPGRGPKKE